MNEPAKQELKTPQTFTLRDKKEVEQFSQLLQSYFQSQTKLTSGHISLVKAFELFQKNPQGGRLFSALLDLEINLNLLFVELSQFGGEWNQHHTSKVFEGGGSILDSKERFFSKMKSHQHSSSYILRYRAIWDKLMGFLILFYLPENYDEFRRSKSRKRKFVQLAKKSPFLGDELADHVSKLIEDFDHRFRTPEAHGTGSLRKWSLSIENPAATPQSELIVCWNALNNIVVQLVERLDIKKVRNRK
ncbi:MAG: hypothetical protein JF609_10820 [Verrucomicrobia bacterium]|nr:hypothetical protein [Verrucomicrobiota bacterium]